MKLFVSALLLCCVFISSSVVSGANTTAAPGGGHGSNHTTPHGGSGGHAIACDDGEHHAGPSKDGIHVANLNWAHVAAPLTITIVALVAAMVRLGYHYIPHVPDHVPESCVLIILGIIFGAIFKAANMEDQVGRLTPNLFFLYLLPPTILDASYQLYDRTFVTNIGSILVFAIVGTLLNCFLIGPIMYGLAQAGAMGSISINFIQMMVFAALIVAVDPVAVLSIFQEIGVNDTLYFIVFGESLLNDGVTVVLYRTMTAFHELPNVPVSQMFLGLAHFIVVVVVGVLIGVLFGVITALFTRITKHVIVLEPLFVVLFAYAAYLVSDMFELSGIISIIACGLVQSRYAFVNISRKSRTTTKFLATMLSGTSDTIIFMYLGIEVINSKLRWHTGFILWSVFLCLIMRGLVVLLLSAIVNLRRLRKIDFEEQFIMAYGGLRGAVAFSLVVMLDRNSYGDELKEIFVTATIVVVFWTVFLQGLTIKPLVKLLRIKKKQEAEKETLVTQTLTLELFEHMTEACEEIIGVLGFSALKERWEHFDERYIKRFLQRRVAVDEKIMMIYEEVALQDHYDALYGSEAADKFKHKHDDKMTRKQEAMGDIMEEDMGNVSDSSEEEDHRFRQIADLLTRGGLAHRARRTGRRGHLSRMNATDKPGMREVTHNLMDTLMAKKGKTRTLSTGGKRERFHSVEGEDPTASNVRKLIHGQGPVTTLFKGAMHHGVGGMRRHNFSHMATHMTRALQEKRKRLTYLRDSEGYRSRTASMGSQASPGLRKRLKQGLSINPTAEAAAVGRADEGLKGVFARANTVGAPRTIPEEKANNNASGLADKPIKEEDETQDQEDAAVVQAALALMGGAGVTPKVEIEDETEPSVEMKKKKPMTRGEAVEHEHGHDHDSRV